MVSQVAATPVPATACADELHRLSSLLSSLDTADGADAAARRAHLRLRQARLSGVVDQLRSAGTAVGTALQRYPDWPDLFYLRASADIDLHRPGAALAHLDGAPGLAESPAGLELRGAALGQLGRHSEAGDCFRRALAADPSWQGLAGLAQVRAAEGEPDAADALYAQAEDELTAKEMSAFAWVRAARGALAASSGDHETAWARYRSAAAAFSGYWLVESHIAGLLRRENRLEEAAAAYSAVHTRTERPELARALGDVHRLRGDDRESARWYAVALAGYQDSAARGEALYLHHLAAFCADVAGQPEEAARWAARDAQARLAGMSDGRA
jgi:tetratricopeptide (TPR) repeat protein